MTALATEINVPVDMDDIQRRERDERSIYAAVGATGRSAASDAELLIDAATIRRYRSVVEGGRSLYPLEQMIAWASPRPGRRILEICGHTGENGAILAHLGASVDSIDIAGELVALAQRRAVVNGLAGRLRASVMSVHALGFADNTFDVVFGEAALHHLDLAAARDEVLRVLKPGGIGVFAEPVAFSPLLRVIRPLVPVPVNRESAGERQLRQDDLDEFCRGFAMREDAHFRALGRLERIVPAASRPLAAVDRQLLRAFPSASRLAGVCVFRLTKAD